MEDWAFWAMEEFPMHCEGLTSLGDEIIACL